MEMKFFVVVSVLVTILFPGMILAQDTHSVQQTELTSGSFACCNNGDPQCKNSPNAYVVSGGELKPENFNCLNNSNLACDAPKK
jgi:hypothetical protein